MANTINTDTSANAKASAIVGQAISRSQMESLISGSTNSFVFEDCDFEGVDLSRLDMRGFEFRDCSFIEASIYATVLSQSTWLRCRGRQADFEAAELVDALFQNCDLNNSKWRRARLQQSRLPG